MVIDGPALEVGQTGFDGCIHTFKDHAGDEGSFKQKGDKQWWQDPVDPEDDTDETNLGHNKDLTNRDEFEALLRAHSINDAAVPGGHMTEWGVRADLAHRASYFWDSLNASKLPRLTRPDMLALASNAAMEAMFGFGEHLEMKYGRWYGETCAGRRHDGWFPATDKFGRRRFQAEPARNAEGMRILKGQHWPEYGIEADPINGPEFAKIIATPFAMHDEHKDSWCPVANSLPAVRSHMKLTEAEAVSLFGAHSIGRVGRAGKTPCNYMTNHFFCPSMCGKNISKGGGMRYNQGFVFDDTPEILDNRWLILI